MEDYIEPHFTTADEAYAIIQALSMDNNATIQLGREINTDNSTDTE